MAKIFRKTKMLARITAEGKSNLLNTATLDFMDRLDGHACHPNLWRQTVYGETDAWYCTDSNGNQYPININDCDDVSD